jgi:hypothetical protein
MDNGYPEHSESSKARSKFLYRVFQHLPIFKKPVPGIVSIVSR